MVTPSLLVLLLAGAPQATPDVPQWVDPANPPVIDVSSLLSSTHSGPETPDGMVEAGSTERPSLKDPGRSAYSLTLFLDDTDARSVFRRYAGGSLQAALGDGGLHRALRDPRLKRSLVLRVAPGMSGVDLAQELRASLKRVTNLESPGARSLLRCVKPDLKEGDELQLRSDRDGSLAIGYAEAGCVTLIDVSFARELLSIWIDLERDSGKPNGLLSKCDVFLR